MEGTTIITLGVLFLACGLPFGLLATGDVTVSNTTDSSDQLTCVTVQGGSYASAASCINGRRIPGCCVDRTSCNYNTSNIDLTLYGPPGYRSSCANNTYACCPLQYVIPITVPKGNDYSQEDLSKEFGDDITDDDV